MVEKHHAPVLRSEGLGELAGAGPRSSSAGGGRLCDGCSLVDLFVRFFRNVVRIRPRNTVVGVPFTPGKFDHSRMAIEYFRPRYGGPKQRAKRAGEYRGRTAFVVGGRRTTG